MKKAVIWILLLAFVLAGCGFRVASGSSETMPTLPELEFKSYTIHRIGEINIVYADGREERRDYEYDVEWNVVDKFNPPPSTVIFYLDGEEVSREHYSWDENGSITRIEKDGNILKNMAYTYDETGRILTEVATKDGAELYSRAFTYDGEGRVVAVEETLCGQMQSRTETLWGDDGRRRSVTVTDGAGAVITRQEYTFDEKKLSETVLEYDGAGTLLRTIRNGYNVDGLIVQEEISGADGEVIQTTCTRFESATYRYAEEVTEPTE